MTDTVLARIAALKAQPITNLKQQWRELFETEPPPYNRRFLEHRLAYRIQELAYGGLKPETIKRLKAIAEDLDGGDPARRRRLANDRPIAGTRLIREYQGVEHCVTVRDEDFEYQATVARYGACLRPRSNAQSSTSFVVCCARLR